MRGLLLFIAISLMGAEHHGQVVFNSVPVPGATVTAVQGTRTLSAVTDAQGNYQFPDIGEGSWKLEVTMSGFSREQREFGVTNGGPSATWELKMLPFDQMRAEVQPAISVPPPAPLLRNQPLLPLLQREKTGKQQRGRTGATSGR